MIETQAEAGDFVLSPGSEAPGQVRSLRGPLREGQHLPDGAEDGLAVVEEAEEDHEKRKGERDRLDPLEEDHPAPCLFLDLDGHGVGRPDEIGRRGQKAGPDGLLAAVGHEGLQVLPEGGEEARLGGHLGSRRLRRRRQLRRRSRRQVQRSPAARGEGPFGGLKGLHRRLGVTAETVLAGEGKGEGLFGHLLGQHPLPSGEVDGHAVPRLGPGDDQRRRQRDDEKEREKGHRESQFDQKLSAHEKASLYRQDWLIILDHRD